MKNIEKTKNTVPFPIQNIYFITKVKKKENKEVQNIIQKDTSLFNRKTS